MARIGHNMTTYDRDTPAGSAPCAPTLVELTHEPVELYKILKFEGLTGSGAEAKQVIAAGLVTVNGVVETRKRKKIVSGDRLAFDGAQLLMCAADARQESVSHENE